MKDKPKIFSSYYVLFSLQLLADLGKFQGAPSLFFNRSTQAAAPSKSLFQSVPVHL